MRLLGGLAGALDLGEVVGRFEKEAEEMRRVVKEEVMVVAERARAVSSPKVSMNAPLGSSDVPFPSIHHGLGSTTSLASNASTSATTSPQSSMFYLRPTVTTPTVSSIPPPLTSPTKGTVGRGGTTRRRKTISRPWGSGGYSSVTSLAELLDSEEQRDREGGFVDEQSRNALGLSQDGGEMGGLGHAPDVDEGGGGSEVWRR